MANTLEEMRLEMKEGLVALRSLERRYLNSEVFLDFLDCREQDYEEFLRFVSPLRRDTSASCVVDFIKSNETSGKFLDMAERTSDYFRIEENLMKEIEAGG